MPYVIRKDGPDNKPYCLYDEKTGERKGCSKTKELAVSHMRARYGAERGWHPTGKKRISQR